MMNILVILGISFVHESSGVASKASDEFTSNATKKRTKPPYKRGAVKASRIT